MGERYWAKPRGLSFGAPDLIEYEKANPPTPKQARLIAKLERSIQKLKNGRYRLDEMDGVWEQVEELEHDLFLATPQDKRITPETEAERTNRELTATFFTESLKTSVLATLPIRAEIEPEPSGAVVMRWVADGPSTVRPSPTP